MPYYCRLISVKSGTISIINIKNNHEDIHYIAEIFCSTTAYKLVHVLGYIIKSVILNYIKLRLK